MTVFHSNPSLGAQFLEEQAAKVSRVDRDIPKSSLTHPQVILSNPQVT